MEYNCAGTPGAATWRDVAVAAASVLGNYMCTPSEHNVVVA